MMGNSKHIGGSKRSPTRRSSKVAEIPVDLSRNSYSPKKRRKSVLAAQPYFIRMRHASPYHLVAGFGPFPLQGYRVGPPAGPGDIHFACLLIILQSLVAVLQF